jgi:C4-type Zn-finger protein
MTHTHQADPHPERIVHPNCPLCGTDMRLVTAEPSPHFVNVDTCKFRCEECGEMAEYAMAH